MSAPFVSMLMTCTVGAWPGPARSARPADGGRAGLEARCGPDPRLLARTSVASDPRTLALRTVVTCLSN
jgi:hypothetical protein